MSQTERKPDLPELPRGLNRMLMTSPRLLPYRPSLVRFLTLGVGTALTAAGLIIGGGLGVLPALGLMAGSALALNTVATLFDWTQRESFSVSSKEPVAATSTPPFLAFAMALGRRLIAPETGSIDLRQSTETRSYRIDIRRTHAIIEMNPDYVKQQYTSQIACDAICSVLNLERPFRFDGCSTARFAEIHAFVLQHEIQHYRQPFWQETYGKSLFLTSLAPTALTLLSAAPSLTQIFATALAPVGIHALDLVRRRQNELDADSAAVRHLGSAAAARHLFQSSANKWKWSPSHPSPALRIASAELQESRLMEAERRSARAAFKALYETTIAEFPELYGQHHPTSSPSSVRQNIPELA